MSQSFKDWMDVLSKLTAAGGILVAALNYRSQTKTKRAEWLKALFEKFYENERFKEVRRWIESKVKKETMGVSDEEEKLTDYLNFFEFISTLEIEGQLRRKDVANLFDYYLQKLNESIVCKYWINNSKYGFENLQTLLKKMNAHA